MSANVFCLDETSSLVGLNSIFCVDMDEVFDSHPKTVKYKNEIKEVACKRKTIIENLIINLDELRLKIKNLTLRISKAKSENNEVLVSKLSKELEDLLVKEKEYCIKIADLAESSKKDISLLENRYTAEVLKDVETLLKKFAKDRYVDVILDKKSILVGKYENITDEVVKTLKENKWS